MNRDQFFARLAPLGEDDLRKALWSPYWRGSKQVRERIESEIRPPEANRRPRAPAPPPDPPPYRGGGRIRGRARAGAYIAGDRRVSPKQRTRWRSEFKQLIADAREHATDLFPTASSGAASVHGVRHARRRKP